MAGTSGEAPEGAIDPAWQSELEALTAIGHALEGLDQAGRRRALIWAMARWGQPVGLELREEPHPHG